MLQQEIGHQYALLKSVQKKNSRNKWKKSLPLSQLLPDQGKETCDFCGDIIVLLKSREWVELIFFRNQRQNNI